MAKRIGEFLMGRKDTGRRVKPSPLTEEQRRRIGEFDANDPVLRAPLELAEGMIEKMMTETATADPRVHGFEQAVVRGAGYIAACVEFEIRWNELVKAGGRTSASVEKSAEAGGGSRRIAEE